MAHFLWTQKQDFCPSPRINTAMTFDAARGRAVLFGGFIPSPVGAMADTWEWDGNNWTQTACFGPSGRGLHALAYDSNRQRIVLCGGSDAYNTLADTLEWDGKEWTQRADTGPAARDAFAVAFDNKRQRVVLFGGKRQQDFFGDTWAWDGNKWTEEQDSGPTRLQQRPSARSGHAMAYDTIRDRVVLFGGYSFAGGHSYNPSNDTWEYDGTQWIRVADTGPPPRFGHQMIYDGAKVLLFGGLGSASTDMLLADTWQWDGKYWTQLQHIGPAPRSQFGMTYDTVRQHTILFGGQGKDSTPLGDTWEWFDHSLPQS